MNVEPLEMFAEEDRTFTLHARDSSNAPKSLTGCTLTWRLGNRPNFPWMQSNILSKSTVITNTASGIYTVTLASTDTSNMHGDYRHQTTCVDGSGNTTVVNVGRFRIRKDIEA